MTDNRWTPEGGPLADAIKDLPDSHPVILTWQGTITTNAQAVRILGANTCISAEWDTPAPQWDGALVVLDATNDLLWRGPDGLYRSGAIGDSDASTAAEIELQYGPVTVLVDADHRYVEVPHA